MQTNRINLRPWSEEDASALFKYASDPDLGPRAGWPPHKSVEESRQIIKSLFLGDGMWAIVHKGNDEIVGCVGYLTPKASNIPIADNDAEVGYWVAKPYWNQGICTEALRLVINHCFQEKGFETLWGEHFIDNPASGRVMEKCGFADTGRQTFCEKLEVGSDKSTRVLKLTRADALSLCV